MARKRWAKIPKEQRAEAMKAIRAKGGGAKRVGASCFCGKYSLTTAAKRKHHCGVPMSRYPTITAGMLEAQKLLNNHYSVALEGAEKTIDEWEAEHARLAAGLPAAAPTLREVAAIAERKLAQEPCGSCGRLPELHQNHGGPLSHDYQPQQIARAPGVS